MAKHIVAHVDEIPPGGRKTVDINGRSIGVFNINGDYYAILNRCPHQGGPLCSGRLTGFVMATQPGEYTYTRRGEIVRCPWHGWEFDIKSGQSWFDPAKTRVRNYPVTVESVPVESVPVESETAPSAPPEAEPPAPGLEPGPYTAETYPVTVEQVYVVVEI